MVRRHVSGDDCASSNYGSTSNPKSRHDRCTGRNPSVVLHNERTNNAIEVRTIDIVKSSEQDAEAGYVHIVPDLDSAFATEKTLEADDAVVANPYSVGPNDRGASQYGNPLPNLHSHCAKESLSYRVERKARKAQVVERSSEM
jgi:hypothetical protein